MSLSREFDRAIIGRSSTLLAFDLFAGQLNAFYRNSISHPMDRQERLADLERYRQSRFGRYIRSFMTRRVELARLAGLFPLWGGAWLRRPDLMVAGAVWILCCWLWGLRRSRSEPPVA